MIGSSSFAPAFSRSFAERGARRDFEGQHRGVDVVVGAVDQRDLDVDHREAGERTRVHDRLDALLDARDVFLRHRTADDFARTRSPSPGSFGSMIELDAGELARTAGLLLVGVVDLGAGDRLAVGHLRRADVGLDLELAQHAVDLMSR
jgi:hypothetical protein